VSRVGADGVHSQKGGLKAVERDEFLRAAWPVMVAEGKDVCEFVFVNERGTHTSFWLPSTGIRLGRERVYSEIPRNREGPNTTLLASMSVGGTRECLAVEGSGTRAVFEAYLEQGFLLSSIEPG
jgi:hypothetical protein